jgi:hypothetical protein
MSETRESTHTSCRADIERDGTLVTRIAGISEAPGWIRKHVAKDG